MIPVIAIVGRPNTGKSTLYNRITGTQDALVADQPGVTRDRHHGFAEFQGRRFILIDTGGLDDAGEDSLAKRVSMQTRIAIDEADVIFWLVDGKDGLSTIDEMLAKTMRQNKKRLYLLVNKTEGLDSDFACAEFHSLGVGTPYPISAKRGYGIDEVLTEALAESMNKPDPIDMEDEVTGLSITVIGRPNVGKSTLINRMLGNERMLTYDQPGTTRDSIMVPFQRHGKHYTLVDTAGVRRKSRLNEDIEKFSVLKALKAVEGSDIVLMVIDASEALTDQDMHLLGLTFDAGKPLIIAANKWDNMDASKKETFKRQLERKLSFVSYASVHFISALHGSGVGKIFDSIKSIGKVIDIKVSSSRLSDILIDAVNAHPPPLVRGRRIKLRYAHLGGHRPIRIIVHGNQTQRVPASYTRYLAGFFRDRLKLTGTPVSIQYKYGDNPYRNKPNVLTERQLRKRQRIIRHSRK
jgi:GTP-binding protein